MEGKNMTKRENDQEMRMRKLGATIALLRQKSGLSLRDFSSKAGLNFSALSRLENGVTLNPSVFFIQKLAKSLGVTVDELMNFSAVECPTCKGTGWVKK